MFQGELDFCHIGVNEMFQGDLDLCPTAVNEMFQGDVIYVWNALPISMRSLQSFKDFKNVLKTHLFTEAFIK
jgi:hypothetical protein